MNLLPAQTLSGADRIHHTDALTLLRSLGDASIDLIATDPPFNVDKADWDTWATVDLFLDWLDLHVREMKRVLKPNGSLYLFCATKYASKVEGVIERHFAVLNNIRWKKPPFSTKAEMFDKEAMRAYFPASESIVFAEQYSSDGKYANAEYELHAVYEPLKGWFRSRANQHGITQQQLNLAMGTATTGSGLAGSYFGDKVEFIFPTEHRYKQMQAAFPLAFNRDYADLRREYEDLRREYEDLRRPFYATPNSPYTDVWEFPTVNTYNGKHPAEKPLAMIRHIVRTSSRPDAVVLDPFMGSGTTAEAAVLEGRRFIGGDFDLHWVKKTRARVENAQHAGEQLAMFAA